MAEVGFHLRPHPYPSRHTFLLLLLHTQNPPSHYHCRSISITSHRFVLLFSSWPLHKSRSRRWDSNAESYNTKNFNFNDNDEGEASDDFDDGMEQWDEVLEDYIDSIWIFKVFRSFGWMLPPIILSLLFATGPKAFLMALALPLWQSTFTFALQRFQNRGKNKQKLKTKTKTKKGRSRAYSSRNVKSEEEAEWVGSQRGRKKKKEYQSWFSKNDVSVSSNDTSAANFGGWDELDAGMESYVESSRKAAPRSSGLRGAPEERGRNKRWSKSDGPLLLRLLISIFPFLSSWTKVL